jgi:hypothetical protein
VTTSNLVYACHGCNQKKGDQTVANPLALLHSGNVKTGPDGALYSTDPDTLHLILQLDLNSSHIKSWRVMMMRIADLAEEARGHDSSAYYSVFGFPEDLPELSRCRPPQNQRKEGIAESWFARRERRELPDVY